MSLHSVLAGKFLAYVEFVKDDQWNRFARLRPFYDVEEIPWAPITDGNARFADDGLVFWWQPPAAVAEHSFWVITLQFQPNYGADSRHRDKFAVVDARSPYQAMVLRDVAGPIAFRRALASGNLTFSVPVVGRPLIRVPGEHDHWILLPESIRTRKHNGHYLVMVTGLKGVASTYAIDASEFQSVNLGGDQFSLLMDIGPLKGYQCTLSDLQLIQNMRKRISAVDRSVLSSLNVTKKLLREYADIFDTSGVGSEDPEKEEVRLQATASLVKAYESDLAYLEEIVEALMDYPQVKEDLKSKLEKELDELRQLRQREIEDEQKAAADQLSKTKEEIKRASQDLDVLKGSLEAAAKDITNAPIDALARHGLLDAMKESIRSGWVSGRRSADLVSSNFDIAVTVIETVEELTKTAIGWAYSAAVDPYMMQVSLATILAHRITLISGASADRLAAAAASVIAADHAVRVSVGTTTFGIADLMNAPVVPVAATSFRNTKTLGDFLLEQPGGDCIAVILSGCNRAPLEVVLPEFLLPLAAGPNVVSWRRDDGQVAAVQLSPRLKLIGTLYSGDAIYRIPGGLGAQLGLVPSGHEEIGGVRLPPQSAPPPSRISTIFLDGLEAVPEGIAPPPLVDWLRKLNVALPQASLTRVLSTYRHLIKDQERALAEAIAGLALGRWSDWDARDLPGSGHEKVVERLKELSKASAWQEAVHYFNLEGGK